jgi:hypothetical protein
MYEPNKRQMNASLQLKAAELYDHLQDTGAWTDADKYENVNLAASADRATTVAQLSSQLHEAFGFPDKK